MALIGMAVFDTVENNRTDLTRRTLESLARTVDWNQHRLFVSDNGSCEATHAVYAGMEGKLPFEVIYNSENLGTANAINLAWRHREPGEPCIKMDNDVEIHQPCWASWMEDVFRRDPSIGICGLKRNDLAECPWSKNPWYKSEIRMLPHERGQRWLVVEEVLHVMGTVQGYSSALLDRIGYLYQPGLYAFDDSLAAVRAQATGFKSVFLHGFEIAHIDPGGTKYTEWKRQYAGKDMAKYHLLRDEYLSGERSVYYDGGF